MTVRALHDDGGNDLRYPLQDVVGAGLANGSDLSYRGRVVIGHPTDALKTLEHYDQLADVGIKALQNRVPREAQHLLTAARNTVRRAGGDALRQVRTSTFHYPSPEEFRGTTTDAALSDVLRTMRKEEIEQYGPGDNAIRTPAWSTQRCCSRSATDSMRCMCRRKRARVGGRSSPGSTRSSRPTQRPAAETSHASTQPAPSRSSRTSRKLGSSA